MGKNLSPLSHQEVIVKHDPLSDLACEVKENNESRKDFSEKLFEKHSWLDGDEQLAYIRVCFNLFGSEDFTYEKVIQILDVNKQFDFEFLGEWKSRRDEYSTRSPLFSSRTAKEWLLIGTIKYNVDEDNYDFLQWSYFVEELENKNVQIGTQSYKIVDHINLMSGIYNMGRKNKVSREQALQDYEETFKEFIEKNCGYTVRPDVYVGVSVLDSSQTDLELIKHYENEASLYNTALDVSRMGPSEIVAYVRERMSHPVNLAGKLIVDLGGHGSLDWAGEGKKPKNEYEKGNMEFGGEDWTKEKFNELFEVCDARVFVSIASCNSGYKLDENQDYAGIIFLDSSKQLSLVSNRIRFLDADVDYNGDKKVDWVERKIYEMISCNSSITPFFWNKTNGEPVRLA